MKAARGKIIQNSVVLFMRMGVIMLITLYTSRIVLQQLGASDFGIYNVVGGIVTIIGFLTGSLSQGIQRFLNFYLGRNEIQKLNQIYSAGIILVTILAIIILLLGETIGLWFLNTQLNIPEDRILAANYIFQFSLFSVLASLYQIPHMGVIMAHENMKAYAYISIFESCSRCGIAYLLGITRFDKLILYAFFLMTLCFIVSFIYYIYCHLHYNEAKFKYHKEKSIYASLLTFSGWNILGTTSNMLTITGINIILNIFFGTIVNAARAISVQVSNSLDSMIQNVQSAMNPQLIKLYSKNEYKAMQDLLIDNTKWNFFLFWMLGLPLFIELDNVLYLWLGDVPEYTSIFIKIIIIRCMLKCFERPLITATFAVGKMKPINLFSSCILGGEIILAIFLYSIGFPPYWCFLVDLIAVLGCIIFDMHFLYYRELFTYQHFIHKALYPIIVIAFISTCITLIAADHIHLSGFLRLVVISCISSFLSAICIFYIGLTKQNRETILSKIKIFIHKKNE